MNFRVNWTPNAIAGLDHLFRFGTDLAAISDAADRIDAELSRDPHSAGEERPPRRRILFDRPMGVIFEVDDASGVVNILAAGWSGRPV